MINKKGLASLAAFTLLEIMVALAVLSFSLVSLLTAHNRALSMSAESITITRAVTLAREEMERIFLTTLPTSEQAEFNNRDDYPEFQWKATVNETPIPGAFEVVVAIHKQGDDDGQAIFTLKAYSTK